MASLVDDPLNVQTRRQKVHRAIFLFGLSLFIGSYLLWMHVNIYALILLLINWIAEGDFTRKLSRIKENRMIWLFISLYFIHAIGIFYTDDLQLGFQQLERKLGLLILPLILGSSRPLKPKRFRFMLWLFVTTISIALLICYVNAAYGYFLLNRTGAFGVHHFHEVLGIHRTYFGLTVAFSATIVIWSLSYRRPEKTVLLGAKLLLLAFLLLSLFLLASRMPLLSMVAVIVLMVYLRSLKMIRKWSLTSIFVALAAIFLLTSIDLPKSTSLERLSNYEETSRQDMWKAGIELLPESLPFGYGLGDVDHFRKDIYLKKGLYKVYNLNYNFHNQYLETALQVGLPGLAILLANFIIVFVIAMRRKKFLAAYLIVLVSMGFLTESMLHTQKGVMFYAFFNALLTFNYLFVEEKNDE